MFWIRECSNEWRTGLLIFKTEFLCKIVPLVITQKVWLIWGQFPQKTWYHRVACCGPVILWTSALLKTFEECWSLISRKKRWVIAVLSFHYWSSSGFVMKLSWRKYGHALIARYGACKLSSKLRVGTLVIEKMFLSRVLLLLFALNCNCAYANSYL